jgi:hypothetical protein
MTVTTALMSFSFMDAVEAFPKPALADPCGSSTPYFHFSTNTYWTSGGVDRRIAARSTIASWTQFKDWDGSALVTPTESSASGSFEITWVNWTDGTNGQTDCTNRTVSMNVAYRDDTATWQAILAHEFGHVLGLDHTGFLDSFGSTGEKAAMTTCFATAADGAVRVFGQDDGGNITHQHTSVAGPSLDLNFGFEQSTYPWGELSGGLTLSNTEKVSGAWGGIYQPTATSNYLYQTMNYVAYGSSHIDGVTSVRRRLTTDTGGFEIAVVGRSVSYDPPNVCSYHNYATGQNQNVKYYGDYVVLAQNTVTPPAGSLTWYAVATSTIAPPAGDAADLKLQVKSYVVNASGAMASVGVDAARIRDRG